jgi:hypothetical protein
MAVVVTPAWVSNAIEQEIKVNACRPKQTDICVVAHGVVVVRQAEEEEDKVSKMDYPVHKEAALKQLHVAFTAYTALYYAHYNVNHLHLHQRAFFAGRTGLSCLLHSCCLRVAPPPEGIH